MKMKQFGLTETKLFHFHRILIKTGGCEGKEPPLDPLLALYALMESSFWLDTIIILLTISLKLWNI